MELDTKKVAAPNTDNIKRTLTVLDKAIDRLMRSNYYSSSEYPEIFLEITDTIQKFYTWLDNYRIYDLSKVYELIGIFIHELGALISELWEICKPKPGKKQISTKRRDHEKNSIMKSINKMLANLAEMAGVKENHTDVALAFEKGIKDSFIKNIVIEAKNIRGIPLRGSKSSIFPWKIVNDYHDLIKDKKNFTQKSWTKFINNLIPKNIAFHAKALKNMFYVDIDQIVVSP